jgi:PcaR/PcaU/PobR family beta-ketoadipate pathway transcriptional regulator
MLRAARGCPGCIRTHHTPVGDPKLWSSHALFLGLVVPCGDVARAGLAEAAVAPCGRTGEGAAMNLRPERPWSDEREDAASARRSSLFVGSLEKGMQVLRAFDRERRVMGLSEIAEASGLDKSSVQRFTFTLHALGYLRKDESTRKYTLSPRVLELGFAYLQTDSLVEYATPRMYEANRQSGESVNITELLGTEVVYVARAPGRHVISVDIFLGMRIPAYACAPGRAILAFLDEAAAAAILDQSELRKFTPKTITSRSGLLRELAHIRSRGYAIAEEQCYEGEISIAAPIFNSTRQPIAALNISVPDSRWSAEQVEDQLAPIVIEASRGISPTHYAAGSHPWFYSRRSPSPPPARKPAKRTSTRRSS